MSNVIMQGLRLMSSSLIILFFFVLFQKEMQGVDAAFYYLANEYYKLYQERIEVFRSLGMQ